MNDRFMLVVGILLTILLGAVIYYKVYQLKETPLQNSDALGEYTSLTNQKPIQDASP